MVDNASPTDAPAKTCLGYTTGSGRLDDHTARTPITDLDALTHATDTRSAAKALAGAAKAAGYAPSIHNTQPWRWRLTGQAIRAMIARTGHPYLVLRLGAIDPVDAGTPRLRADQIIERY